MNRLGNLFNEYNQAFIEATEPTEDAIHVVYDLFEFQLYGNADQKNAEWCRLHPGSGEAISWMSVSGKPVEIWGDLRQTKQRYADGKPRLVFNQLAMGHELQHALRVIMSDWKLKSENPDLDGAAILSPDELVKL